MALMVSPSAALVEKWKMTTEKDPYKSVLSRVAQKKNLEDIDVKRLDAIVRRVGWVESKNDPSAVQKTAKGTGPGRGMFQYEKAGKNGSGATAANRLRNFEKNYGPVDIPEADRKELKKADPDFSALSEATQKAVLIADWVMRTPGDEVGQLARGEMDPKDFYLDYHWAGHGGDEQKRLSKQAQWDREMMDYSRLVGGQR